MKMEIKMTPRVLQALDNVLDLSADLIASQYDDPSESAYADDFMLVQMFLTELSEKMEKEKK